MNYRHVFAVTALAAGLAGCASMSSNYQSNVRYQDGSYYSPAEAGYGDYYYAPEPRYDYYYDHSYFFGSPFYSFGAPCSFRYRYCSPFGYDPFYDPYYGFGWYGWYDPFWAYYGYHWQHHRHHSDDDHDDADDDSTTTPTDQDGTAVIADWAALPQRRQPPGRMMAAPEAERDPNAGFPRERSERVRRDDASAPAPRRSESSASEERSSESPARSTRRRSERID